MDTKELRIGNYVTVDGEVRTVQGINSEKENRIQVRNAENKITDVSMDDLSAIPLTGELVIRCCKFEEDGHHIIGIDNHRYYLKVEDGFVVLLNKKKEAMIHFWDVQNLHQLQNLYFALKGKEMEVVFN